MKATDQKPDAGDLIEVRTLDNDLYEGVLLSWDETECVLIDEEDTQWNVELAEILSWRWTRDDR